jgi:hypothetical protein
MGKSGIWIAAFFIVAKSFLKASHFGQEMYLRACESERASPVEVNLLKINSLKKIKK